MAKIWTVEIPIKVPSLNEYIAACRTNYHKANKMKHDVQSAVGIYISHLPRMKRPVTVDFLWTEKNNRRDYDNISSCGRKFILDALVSNGKLLDDNRKFVKGFSDDFDIGADYKVTLTIREVEDDTQGKTHGGDAKVGRGHRKNPVGTSEKGLRKTAEKDAKRIKRV